MRTGTDESGSKRVRAVSERSRQYRDRLGPVGQRIRSRFEVDARALAALRIALGLILLVDLIHRAGNIGLFYTDDGAYPLASYEAAAPYGGYSLHALSGEPWFQGFLFALAGLFAVALIVGYRTRLVALVSLVLLVSLHARNPAVLNGGDRLLRVLLFLALLTPLGERWSIDALRRGSARTTVAGFTTTALLVQPIAVFSSNAVLKHDGDTWYSGEALEIAFANDVMTVYLGNYLADYSTLLEAANWLWVTLLAGSAVLLLATTGRARAVFALAYLGAFAGMLLTLMVGLFPLVLGASVLPFLTAPFWNGLARLVPDGWKRRLPTASQLGPLGRPPLERRGLEWLRRNGRESTASLVVDYGRSLLTVAGAIVLVWIVLFSASHATGTDLPDALEANFPDEQRWGLYAPDPSESYSWYVVEAELADGSTVEPFEGGTVAFDRPPDASEEYDTFRHRKFMSSVSSSSQEDTNDVVADRYADWACERAQDEHDGEVTRITVIRVIQSSPVDGEYEDPTPDPIIERRCDSSPAVSE